MLQAPPITDRDWFQWFIATVMVMNIFAIGIETDASCVGCSGPDARLWLGINSIFAAIYVTEFAIKFYYFGWNCLKGRAQILDSLLVLVAVVDTWILQFVIQSHSARNLSMLGVLRVVSLSRVLKFMMRQTELRLLIQSFRDLYKFLVPMIVGLTAVLYFTALIMGSTYQRGEDDKAYSKYSRWSGHELWGTLPRTMFTLFQVTTGDKWAKEIVRPLIRLHPNYLFLFVPFTLFMFFGFRAALIARACDSVIQSGSVAENRLKAQEKHMHTLIEKLRRNFITMKESENLSGEGYLNYAELTKFCRIEENRKVLAALNVPVSDLGELFCILGGPDQARIVLDSFFSSVLRLTGPAMGRHVTSIQMRTQWMASKAAHMVARIARLDDWLKTIDGRLADIAKLYGLKNGLKLTEDINLITVEIYSEAGTSSGLRGSASSLSLRSKRGRILREKYKDSRNHHGTSPFGSFLI